MWRIVPFHVGSDDLCFSLLSLIVGRQPLCHKLGADQPVFILWLAQDKPRRTNDIWRCANEIMQVPEVRLAINNHRKKVIKHEVIKQRSQ